MLKRLQILFLGTAVIAPLCVSAFSVSSEDAATAACAFARRGRTLGARLGRWVEKTAEHTMTNGVRYFAVKMYGGGTVFTSDDTDVQPIVAFTSATNDFSRLDPASPLAALLRRDAERRRAVGPHASQPATAARWDALLNDTLSFASSGTGASLTTLPDVRVAPLVQSQWDQSTVGGKACYNYCTPQSATADDPGNANNAVCGCVATAMSQVMRYHAFPNAAVPSVTHDCWFGTTRLPRETSGGPYVWDQMPLVPSSATLTDANRQAIGRLTADAGIGVYMQYTSNSSGAYTCEVGGVLEDAFDYAQACSLNDSSSYYGLVSESVYARTLLSNFDAGLPVILGISTQAGEGHCIVGDGYGYSDEELYVHLNMGWSGNCDVWYNLPKVEASGYVFRFVDDIVYNIQPTRCGAVLSGRIVDPSGTPVAGASVTIYPSGSATPVTNVVSSGTGIYAAVLPAGSYRVCAAADDPQRTGEAFVTGLAEPTRATYEYNLTNPDGTVSTRGIRLVTDESTSGNSWGNDIVIWGDCVTVTVGAAGASVRLDDATPAIGSWTYEAGTNVTLRAPLLATSETNAFGVSCFRHACLGWTGGTGGIPATGATNEVTVTLTGDASIIWLYDATPSQALQRTYVSTYDYKLYSGGWYSTFWIENVWRDYGERISYVLPEDAAWPDGYDLECYYRAPNAPPWHYSRGTLNLRLFAVELSVPGEEGTMLYDAARHYAMPTNVSFVADHGQDVVFYYLPASDKWSSALPTWWVYRTMLGALENGLVTEAQTADTADPDGDGCTNVQEYRRGTDPLDSSSVIRYPSVLLVK